MGKYGWMIESRVGLFRVVRYSWWWPFGPTDWICRGAYFGQFSNDIKEFTSHGLAKDAMQGVEEKNIESKLKWKEVKASDK